jgi:hypothetical protein
VVLHQIASRSLLLSITELWAPSRSSLHPRSTALDPRCSCRTGRTL